MKIDENMLQGPFGEAYRACQSSVIRDGRVYYNQRADIDAAAKTVFDKDGLSYHGLFHFYFGVTLFSKCASRTLPIWNRIVPNEDLNMLFTILSDGIRRKIGNKEIRNIMNRTDSIIQKYIYNWDEEKINTAGAAGPSCTTALSMYLGDFNFATNVSSEQEIDIYYWDSAFYSSIAIAGGPEWQVSDSNINLAARNDFWIWYVEEAIPGAYNDASMICNSNR